MKNETKTKEKLIQELETLRAKLAAFEKAEAEHKRTQDELRKSEERFRKIFEYSNDAVFILDPERDKIIDVNPRTCDKSVRQVRIFPRGITVYAHNSHSSKRDA